MNSFITTFNINPAPRRFVLLMLRIVGSIVVGIALLNFFIDPYNRYGNNRLGVYISAARQTKPTEVNRFPHNALLMGNSRMEMIPVSKLEHFKFFNAAFSGGTPEEAFYFLQHYARKEELVIIGVDLGQTDPSQPAGDIFLPPDAVDVMNDLLSLKTLEYSFRTIIDRLESQPPSFAPDGSAETFTWFRLYDKPDPARQKWQLEGMKTESSNFSWPGGHSINFYKKIAALLRERGIPCVIVIPPMHEAVADHIKSTPVHEAYQAWRVELGTVFSNIVDLSFSSYDAPENFYKSDSIHFKPDIGVRLFNEKVIPEAILALQTETEPAAKK